MPDLASLDGFQYDGYDIAAPNPGLILGRLLAWYGSVARGLNKAMAIGVKEELMTIGTGATTLSVDATLLPANSCIIAVVGRVTVAIPTAATFTVGDATNPARFATGIAVAANTTFVGTLHRNPAVASDALGPRQVAASALTIDPSSNPANNNGRVVVQVIYEVFTPPTA